MATNTSFVSGLRPVDNLRQPGSIGRVRRYFIPSTDATAVFLGDAVKSAGSADSVTGLPTIAQAAAGDTIRGVVVGFDPVDGVTLATTNLNRVHRPASTAMYALVADDPDLVCEIQEDAVGGALAVTDIGENCDLVVGSGNATTGLSGMQVDSSTHVTTTAQVRLVGFVNRSDNVIGSANAKMLVVINEHEFKSTSGV